MNHVHNYQRLLNVFGKEDLLPPVDPIVLFYGEPGTGKTGLSLTAGKNPLLLDFNQGAHRALVRAQTAKIDSYEQILQLEGSGGFQEMRNAGVDTIVYDTIDDFLGRMITPYLYKMNPKYQTSGDPRKFYGALKTEFLRHFNYLRTLGFTIVFVAHQKAEGNRAGTDNLRVKPMITGGSYDIIMSAADVVGYLFIDSNGKRVLSFDATQDYFGKNPLQIPNMFIPHVDASQPVPESYRTLILDNVIAPVRKTTQQMSAEISTPVPQATPQATPQTVQIPEDWRKFVLDQSPPTADWARETLRSNFGNAPELFQALTNLLEARLVETGGATPPSPVAPTPTAPAATPAPVAGNQDAILIAGILQQFRVPKDQVTVNKLREIGGTPFAQNAGLTPQLLSKYNDLQLQAELIPAIQQYI